MSSKARQGSMEHGVDEVADVSKGVGEGADHPYGSRGYEEQPSLLTDEQNEALQQKSIKVVNPWIHEATHKEYLENVKVGLFHLLDI
jgi:hypothetical protein